MQVKSTNVLTEVNNRVCIYCFFFITHYITIDYIWVFALQVKQLVPNLKLIMLTDCTVM